LKYLKNLDKGAEILIVTEGSSDTNILKKGLDMLYPSRALLYCLTPATSLSKITRISFLMRILVSPLQKLKRFPSPANG
jgi:hypothetical protein